MRRILLIEDDPILNRNITDALKDEQMETEGVMDSASAEQLLRDKQYDCVILDVNLPGKNGFEICKAFRAYNASTPVLILTAYDELDDKVQGFDSGADDYLTKPFFMRELLLRIHALLKRQESTNRNEQATLKADDIVVHFPTGKVTRQGKEIALTPREFQILVKLIERKGELVSKAELAKDVWGSTLDSGSNTIEVYINFLRNKLDKPFGKQSIRTKIGYGYFFEGVNEN